MEHIYEFTAVNDKRAETQGFRVTGTVTVANPTITAVLIQPEVAHLGGWEELELKFEGGDQGVPDEPTRKTVSFERKSGTGWSFVKLRYPEGGDIFPIEVIE
ncbi:hypothetical protein IAE35_13090 [Pseudomonas sp. S75]|uniref:hypothetical protein n=1 Tax=unclassified Pseudomonas TaxID=196821 RepID=UPI001902CBD7|nr:MULTISPECIES: hypothetical protein [unclassified Pseudomonas]MBJ9974413.1 hypothetical protein [Pseudomonas sp. S30]MBK0154278.1 hypothetical protein [Pseudomonas sp. S75]